MSRPLVTTMALLAGVTLSVAGCTSALEPSSESASTASEAPASSQEVQPPVTTDVLDTFSDSAPEEGTDAYLAWFALMGPDGEYAAAALYQAVIDEYGPVEPYVSIKEGEERHIDALTRQLERRGFDVPENPYLSVVSAPADLQSAAEAWAEGEIANVEMYDDLIAQTDDESLLRVLENLRRASLESHLPLFELAAENGGSLTADQMPSELGASHSDMRKGGHEDRAMRGEKRDEGHGPQHRS